MSTDAATQTTPAFGLVPVTFAEESKACHGAVGKDILSIAKVNGVQIMTGTANWASCRGLGLCGTCRVNVDPAANVNPPTFFERFMLGKDAGKLRLACQAKITGEVTVKLKPARDYSDAFHNVVFQTAMIGAFSVVMVGFLVMMLIDIVGIRF